jgi:hypothetical protein
VGETCGRVASWKTENGMGEQNEQQVTLYLRFSQRIKITLFRDVTPCSWWIFIRLDIRARVVRTDLALLLNGSTTK